MNYKVLIEKGEDGIFVGKVLGLKGCHSDGESIEELMKNLKEAIELYEEVNNEKVQVSNIPKFAFVETLKV